jgi:hypothetical protein
VSREQRTLNVGDRDAGIWPLVAFDTWQFKAADTDNDGTLTARELRTKAGRQLLRLLK